MPGGLTSTSSHPQQDMLLPVSISVLDNLFPDWWTLVIYVVIDDNSLWCYLVCHRSLFVLFGCDKALPTGYLSLVFIHIVSVITAGAHGTYNHRYYRWCLLLILFTFVWILFYFFLQAFMFVTFIVVCVVSSVVVTILSNYLLSCYAVLIVVLTLGLVLSGNDPQHAWPQQVHPQAAQDSAHR